MLARIFHELTQRCKDAKIFLVFCIFGKKYAKFVSHLQRFAYELSSDPASRQRPCSQGTLPPDGRVRDLHPQVVHCNLLIILERSKKMIKCNDFVMIYFLMSSISEYFPRSSNIGPYLEQCIIIPFSLLNNSKL